MTQQTIDNLYTDWLGNQISVGDWVLYSSKSTNVGMNLGRVEHVSKNKIQIRIARTSQARTPGKLITLLGRDSAYRSVTRYIQALLPLELKVDNDPELEAELIKDWQKSNAPEGWIG